MSKKVRAFVQGYGVSFLRGAGVAFIIKILGAGAALLLQLILARLMDIDEYGQYTYLVTWVGIISGFTSLGFSTSIIRFIPEYLKSSDFKKLRGVIRTSVYVTLLTSLLFSVLGGLLILFLQRGDWVPIMIALISLPFLALLKLFSRIENGKKRMFMTYGPLEVFRNILIAITVSTFFYFGFSMSVNLVLVITTFVIATLVLFHTIELRKKLAPEVFITEPEYHVKQWLTISMPLVLINGFLVVLNRTDIIMLGIFSTKADVAVYNVALKISTLTTFILAAVTAISAPSISQLYFEEKMNELQKFARRIAHLVFWPTLFVSVLICAFSNFILGLFGAEFQDGKILLFILLVGQLFNASVGSVGYYLNMTGHQKDSSKVFGITALVNIIVSPISIYYFGAIGAAVTTVISMILWNFWLYRLVRLRLGINSFIV